MKRTPLRKKGKSESSKTKDRIQALLRQIVIKRDGGCVLRHYPEARRSDCGNVLQAEHLNGRANSVSYGELDNIVCLCVGHHIFYKKQSNARYWVLIQRHVGEERWAKIQKWILDTSPHRMTSYDWQVLEDKLKAML